MRDMRKLKWLPCLAGGLLCLLGLACLVWPKAVSGMLAMLIDVYKRQEQDAIDEQAA